MRTIIFVCTGNVCRSPMAHHYMQKKIKELGLQDEICVKSAGTEAYTGNRATEFAIKAISKHGVEMNSHRAMNVQDVNIEDAELIICMTTAHVISVINRYPKMKDKTYTLKQYVEKDRKESKYIDIDDPWGLSITVYEKTADEIVENVDKLINKIKSIEK